MSGGQKKLLGCGSLGGNSTQVVTVILIQSLIARIISCMLGRPVSLAKWKGVENLIELLCKSLMYKSKIRGPITEPCGTLKLILSGSDESFNQLKRIAFCLWDGNSLYKRITTKHKLERHDTNSFISLK